MTTYRVYVKKNVYPKLQKNDTDIYVILTQSTMYFSCSMKECAEMLRANEDQTSLDYAGELMPLHRRYLSDIVKQNPV
jgi:hypothetical protein